MILHLINFAVIKVVISMAYHGMCSGEAYLVHTTQESIRLLSYGGQLKPLHIV